MRSMTDGSRFARATLVGDLLGLFAFLVLGLDRHGEDVVARFAALASIFAAAWLVTAWFLGTYRPPTYARWLLTLVLWIPLGVAIRATFVQAWTATEILTFAGVAILFGTMFVGAARLVTTWRFGGEVGS